MEINQYDITMTTHYYITISTDMCTYHGITMHNDAVMNLFYYVFSRLPNCVILLWVVWNKNKNRLLFDQQGLVSHSLFLYRTTSLALRTHELFLDKHNSCSPQTDQSLVLVITFMCDSVSDTALSLILVVLCDVLLYNKDLIFRCDSVLDTARSLMLCWSS